MKHIERMTRLVGTIANRVMLKEDANGKYFEYRPIYYYDAFSNNQLWYFIAEY